MVEITLASIHLGSARRVVTLGLDGRDLAYEFLTTLRKSNPRGAESLITRIQTVAEHDRFENEFTFRSVRDGIFEFKRPGLRLYAFYDEVEGLDPQLIIATNGGTKNNKKEQQADIARTQSLRNRYLAAKKVSTTRFRLKLLDHEN
jgi:ABC-type Fe3+-hydroxamate transport system substrate-binding protein